MKVIINLYDKAGKKVKKSGKKGSKKSEKKQGIGCCGVVLEGMPMEVAEALGIPAAITEADTNADQAEKAENHHCTCGGTCNCVDKMEEKNDAPTNCANYPSIAPHKVGDIITVKFDGKDMECLVVETTSEYCEVVSLDIPFRRCINENGSNKGGFDASDLLKYLNSDEVLGKFTKHMRNSFVPYPDGSKVRIPTEKQIFGENKYGVTEDESVKQFAPMTNPRNRIAFWTDEDGDTYTIWYWLETVTDGSSTHFCDCFRDGYAHYNGASGASGVRLRFRIKNR